MNKPVIMLTPGRGHVGSFLLSELLKGGYDTILPPPIAKDLHNLRPSDLQHGITHVINTVGYTDLINCERHFNRAHALNTLLPTHIASVLTDYTRAGLTEHVHLIHLSTGCLYPHSIPDAPATPLTPETYTSAYTQTKLAGDNMLRERPKCPRLSISIVRPRLIHSHTPHQRNALNRLRLYPTLFDSPNSWCSIQSLTTTIMHMINVGHQQCPELVLAHDPGPAVTPFEVGVIMHDHGLRKWPSRTTPAERQQLNWPAVRTDAILLDQFSEEATRDLPNSLDQLKINIGRLAEALK